MNLPDKLPTKKSFLTRIMEGTFFPANKNTLRVQLDEAQKTVSEQRKEIETLKATVTAKTEENQNLHHLITTTDGGELYKVVREGEPPLYVVVFKNMFPDKWVIKLKHPLVFKLEIATATIGLKKGDNIVLERIRVNQFYQQQGYGKIFLQELIILMSRSRKHWQTFQFTFKTSAELEITEKLFRKFNFTLSTHEKHLLISPPGFRNLTVVANR